MVSHRIEPFQENHKSVAVLINRIGRICRFWLYQAIPLLKSTYIDGPQSDVSVPFTGFSEEVWRCNFTQTRDSALQYDLRQMTCQDECSACMLCS